MPSLQHFAVSELFVCSPGQALRPPVPKFQASQAPSWFCPFEAVRRLKMSIDLSKDDGCDNDSRAPAFISCGECALHTSSRRKSRRKMSTPRRSDEGHSLCVDSDGRSMDRCSARVQVPIGPVQNKVRHSACRGMTAMEVLREAEIIRKRKTGNSKGPAYICKQRSVIVSGMLLSIPMKRRRCC
jgi:hypothetical protein